MSEKMKLEIPQTRGSFSLVGIVEGVTSTSFYTESTTQNNKTMRTVRFGVRTSTNNKVYVTLRGFIKDKVYFSKRVKTEDGKQKTETKAVNWDQRTTFSEKDYRLIGVNLGLSKKLDEKGNEVNDNMVLVEYDACLKISQLLKDGMAVFVKGSMETSSFVDKNGNTRVNVDLQPNQISLLKDQSYTVPTDESLATKNDLNDLPATFETTIVYKGIQVNREEPSILTAYSVGYRNLCEVDFTIHSQSLANIFSNPAKIKPYSSIKVKGIIVNSAIEKVDENADDGWGMEDSSTKITEYVREYIITRAEPNSIDTKTYSKESIEKAMTSMNEFKQGTQTNIFANTTANVIDDEEEWG